MGGTVARRKKNQGFNTPFGSLSDKLTVEPGPVAKPQPPRAHEPPKEAGEQQLFEQAMSGVRPLDDNRERVEPKKSSGRGGPTDEQLALSELRALVDGTAPFSIVESEEHVAGAAPGVTHELVRTLERGDYAFRRHVDLHGLHKDEARDELHRFITAARKDGERCLLVITGRGKSSPDGTSVLKEALPRWLSRAPLRAHVLAFCTAQAVHGGPGAFYVLLRRPGVRPFGD